MSRRKEFPQKPGRKLAQDPTSRYARKLGVETRRIRRMGGRERLKSMHPPARKVLLRQMFNVIEKKRKP